MQLRFLSVSLFEQASVCLSINFDFSRYSRSRGIVALHLTINLDLWNLEGGVTLREGVARPRPTRGFFFSTSMGKILSVHFFKHRVSSAGTSMKFNRGEKLDAREVYWRGEEFFERLKNIFCGWFLFAEEFISVLDLYEIKLSVI